MQICRQYRVHYAKLTAQIFFSDGSDQFSLLKLNLNLILVFCAALFNTFQARRAIRYLNKDENAALKVC